MTTDTAALPVLLQLHRGYVPESAPSIEVNGVRIAQTHGGVIREIRRECEAGYSHREPLLQIAMGRREVVGILRADADFPLHKVSSFASVCLVLPGHDGPDAWGQRPQLARWARRVVLHDRKPDPAHYAQFAQITSRVGKLLLIETTPKHRAAWLSALAQDAAEPVSELGVLPGYLVPAALPAIA